MVMAVIGAVACCIACMRCVVEVPQLFPSVPREEAFPDGRLSLSDRFSRTRF
jgi:hypothetical protein